ncbi:kinase-like domain-containing protein [Thelephora terrestris]|uniref:Kinase-like domain-containing protein n=1 Tax=Thelephora terrestris TaxID=56493 RepID=A0A9P6HM73_9AGAM|nr:kinase-like domain-containing protein [Thelephora terrestris]
MFGKAFMKVFCKEVAGWRRISHPNIVPFLGVSEAPAPISMVSEWMPNGDVRSYVIKNPEVSRLQLLLDISRGLSFLHSLEIVHGDLKGANILVDKSGRARINDFGLTIIASLNCTETSASSGGTYRWMAPELLGLEQNPNKRCLPTPQSDAFALGMVAIEVFTGQVPFPELTRPFAVTIKLVDGERPPRPPKASRLGLSNELWAAVQSLWAHEPGDRPPLITFVDLLKRFNPDMGLLEELKEFDANSDKHIEKLNNILHYGDNALFGMREDESLVLIELFDRVLNSSLVDENIRGRCLRGLQKVSARCGLLPKSYWIAHDSLAQSDEALSATGRISDTCKRSLNGKLVAVKMINPDCVGSCGTFRQVRSIASPNRLAPIMTPAVFLQRLRTNAVMWKQLRHPNVVNFLGLVSDSPLSSLVYPWMPNGTLSEYLRKHPDVDKLSLLWDVARGLVYLHQDNLVHEYGLELVLREEASSRSTLANVRWMAPEVLSAENKSKLFTVEDVKRADVYSLAMVMFEILTGTAPLEDASDEVVLKEVITGLRPEWPSDDPSQALIDALRNQVEACWCYDPEERPTALMALQSLQAFAQERDKERLQETQHLLEQGDDDSWDYLDDAAEVASKTHKGRREYLHLHLSGSTLVHESINRIREVFPHHGDSSTSSRDPTQGRRAKVKKGRPVSRKRRSSTDARRRCRSPTVASPTSPLNRSQVGRRSRRS